jgi:hypothetical protein
MMVRKVEKSFATYLNLNWSHLSHGGVLGSYTGTLNNQFFITQLHTIQTSNGLLCKNEIVVKK